MTLAPNKTRILNIFGKKSEQKTNEITGIVINQAISIIKKKLQLRPGNKLPGTNDLILDVFGKFLIGKKEVQMLIVNLSEWILIDPITYEKVEFKIKNSKDIIKYIGRKHKFGTQIVREIITDKNQTIFINPETLEKVEITIRGIDEQIKYIGRTEKIGKYELREVLLSNGKKAFINIVNLEVINIKGADGYIANIGNKIIIGSINYIEIKTSSGESMYLNTNNFEVLRVSGTNEIIKKIKGYKTIFGGQEIQEVILNNDRIIFVDLKKFKLVEIHINKTNEKIISFGETISIDGQEIQEVKTNKYKKMYINTKTLEGFRYMKRLIVDIVKNKSKIIFTTQDGMQFEIDNLKHKFKFKSDHP